jgi:hypothetical protein
VFRVIGYLLFFLLLQGGALYADVTVVVMTMKGGIMKMMNPMTMRMKTMKNITMMGAIIMDRKLYQFEI